MTGGTVTALEARSSFEVLFCTPDEQGHLCCSAGETVKKTGLLLSSLLTDEEGKFTASPADCINALCRGRSAYGFRSQLFRELLNAFANFRLFPAGLETAPESPEARFLLGHALRLCRFLKEIPGGCASGERERIFPGGLELFAELPGDCRELIEALKKEDPFSSGQVFCYDKGEFIPVEPVSVRDVGKFFGYLGVKSAYAEHFRDFAAGRTNLPLLINSLPGYGKTSMVLSFALEQPGLIPVLAGPEALEDGWNLLIQLLASRKDHRFVLFFDDIDPGKIDWYNFRTNVGGAFAPPENVMPVLTANYEFPASILSRGRKISYPVFDELRCSEMIEDFLRSFGMKRPPVNLISLIGAEYVSEFAQKKFTELSPRTLIRYLKIYETDQNKRRTMIELASGEMITRPDPEMFYEFNINLMRSLYGEEYIQNLLKEKLRNL